MKIKKFKNLWTMGLIIFGAILVTLYLAKLIVPEFVVKIAEVDSIVRFGTYVDTHKWALYLFNFVTSFIAGYFYCCASCRKRFLTFVDNTILITEILFMFVIEKFLPDYLLVINIVCMILMPLIICFKDKQTDIKYLYSTGVCLSINLLSQVLSLLIRNISMMITATNSATFSILLIDGIIWMVLLYNFYNFKENIKYGKN